jgi:hypothetical protein
MLESSVATLRETLFAWHRLERRKDGRAGNEGALIGTRNIGPGIGTKQSLTKP